MSKRILSLFLVLSMVFTMSINVFASPMFTFFSMSSPTEVVVGKTVTVYIKAEPQSDLSKMTVTMPFDPDVLEYVSHEITFDFPGQVNVSVGEDSITLKQNGSTPYFLENTTFLKVTFNVLAPYENYEFTLDLGKCSTTACEPNGDGTYYEYALEPRMSEDYGGPSYTTFKAACVDHNFVLESAEPDCIYEGYSYERCSNCNETRNYTPIPALGHSYADGFCIRCGEKEGVWQSGSHNDHRWELLGNGGFGGTLVIGPEEGMSNVEIEDNDDVNLVWHEWNFGFCSGVTSIVIEEGVSRIGDIAFYKLHNVETVELPSTLTSIGRDAFKDCRNLTTVNYNGEEEDWENIEVAEGNDNLLAIIENGSGTGTGSKRGSIGKNATWELNDYGVLILFGNGELALDDDQFDVPWAEYVDEIQRIVIGEGITSIERGLFARHRTVSSISLPETLEIIGERAFYMCNAITEIYIPANVRVIDDLAFAGCRPTAYSISSANKWFTTKDGVLFDKAAATLIAYPVGQNEKSYTIPSTVNEIYAGAFMYSRLEEIEIPDSVRVIGDNAFFNSNRLKAICLPSSLEQLGEGVFSRCMRLESIEVNPQNQKFRSAEGILFDKEMRNLIHCPANKEIGYFEVPDSVCYINREAFANNQSLISVTLPKGLMSIDDYAFDDCESLVEVIFPVNMRQFSNIGFGAFCDCTALEYIAIPEGVEYLYGDTFWGCEALSEISLPNSLIGIEEGAFGECINLTDVYYHGSEEDWDSLWIGDRNDCLLDAVINFEAVVEIPVGDVNGDTEINSADVNLIYRVVMDYAQLTEGQTAAADVNDDGTVNSADVNLLYRYVMGFVDEI